MNNLKLYPEDFAKWHDWTAVCDSLNIPYESISVEIIYERVYAEEEIETNRLYCTICESAYIETTQELNADSFYCCNMCREFENSNDVEIRENNFDESKAIDYAN
jgi:CO dehydrogenase/acetyl-CoA synthase beta subunit